MRKFPLVLLAMSGLLVLSPAAQAQQRPYIGFAYPAGGQQGTTFQVVLGGQNLDDVELASITGDGVTAKVLEYHRRLGPQEIQLLAEQLRELKKGGKGAGDMMMSQPMMETKPGAGAVAGTGLVAKIEKRIASYVQRPACQAISNLATIEVTIAPEAKPGRREITLGTPRGLSNSLVFYVGQLPEYSRKPMSTAHFQVLGKEELALRKRPLEDVERAVKLPCTLNGQIASGEINRYRFTARKGQKLVISCEARELIPFVADAVPGWLQPVMSLYNDKGKEVAYADDYRFRPDPVILYEVPKDGEYILNITDAIFRGREDFVYRITMGEMPFVTSIFPLGGKVGAPANVEIKGWNLQNAKAVTPPSDAGTGRHMITALRDKVISNAFPFQLDSLPEMIEKESNDDLARAEKVTLPILVNGRIDKVDDWDVFQFAAKAGDTVVAEVSARRLGSPLDSVLRITDSSGKVLAFNDDFEDVDAGSNTHDADSYIMVKLPADGTYFVHVGDTARHGGEEFAYRLRISAPRPDFALKLVPSTVAVRGRGMATASVFAFRKDGFNAPIKLTLKNPPKGISAAPVVLQPNQAQARFSIQSLIWEAKDPLVLTIEGSATVGAQTLVHSAVPAEDRMQAFLWRHLVPCDEFKMLVHDGSNNRNPKRAPAITPTGDKKPTTIPTDASGKPKFSKQQVAGRLRQLKLLYEEGLFTESFYQEHVAECEAAR